MPKNSILTPSRYTKLVKDIRVLIEEGRARATRAANQELVQTYWNVGRRICEEGLTENAGYSQAILEDLAEELSIDFDKFIGGQEKFLNSAEFTTEWGKKMKDKNWESVLAGFNALKSIYTK